MRYSPCLVSAIYNSKWLHFSILYLCLTLVCGCQDTGESYPQETIYDHIGLLRREPTPQQLERATLEPEQEIQGEAELVPGAKIEEINKSPIAVLLLDSAGDSEATEPGVEAEAKPLVAEPAKLLSQSPAINLLSNLDWSIQQWADPGELIVTDGPPQGLRLLTQKGTQGKISLAAPLPRKYLAEQPRAITLSASMPAEPLFSLACFVRARKTAEYFESRAMPLNKSEKQLVFRLAQPIWKSEQSKWEFTQTIPEGQEIGELGFVLYDTVAGSEVFINKIEIILAKDD